MAHALSRVLAASLLLAVANARGQASSWTTGTVRDPATLDERPAAVVTNPAGFRFAVARDSETGRALGIFWLPTRDPDFLDEALAPELALDGGPFHLAPLVSGTLKTASVGLWEGFGEPVVGLLRDLMEGRELVVRYPLAGGGQKETSFSLAGAKAAIAEVLGVAAEVSPELRDLALAREAAMQACLGEAKAKARKQCTARLANCAQAATADELRACLAASR